MQAPRWIIAALVAALVGGTVAASHAQSAASAAQVRTLTAGGIARTYRVVHPPSAGAGAALVVMLHGGFGTGANAENADGWDALAGEHGFVVAYPDGVARAWNAGRCCGRPYEQNLDDVGFLTAVVHDIENRDGTDPARVYVAGLSNGAIMAYRMACEAPIRIAAIGPVAGDLEVECATPRGPVSVLAIHGTADQNVPIGGGYGTKGVTHTDHTPVAASLARWRSIDGCGAPSEVRRPPVTTQTAQCRGGAEVGLVTIEGAGHQWPGSRPPPAWAVRMLQLDQPSHALDAATTLWEFFARHRSDG